MSKFWFFITVISVVILASIGFRIFSATSNYADNFASFSYLSIIGLLICSSLFARNIKMQDFLRNTVIWLAVFFALMFGYNMRYDLQDILNTLSAGIIPASQTNRFAENDTALVVERNENGDFIVDASLNNQPIHMLIDLDATSILLSYEDAQTIGIDVNALNFNVPITPNPITTNNENTYAASIQIDSIKIGNISRRYVPSLVSPKDKGAKSLLGKNFLNRLSRYSVRGNHFTLID